MGRLRVRQTTNFGTTIPECGIIEFPIPTSPPTTPPYTLIVYASNMAVPSAYPLNLTGQRASWTVVYSGTVVLTIYIVDSRGTSVGYPAQYTVQPTNDSRACLPPSRPTVQSPITAVIDLPTADANPQMCNPLLIHVTSGQKPYNVTVVPVGIAPAFNITMGPNDDTVRWVNPFPPSTRFSVAVSDSQGASKVIRSYDTTGGSNSTTGGTDTNCPNSDTRTFDSNNPNDSSSNSTIAIATASDDIINRDNDRSKNTSNGVPTAAIVGGAVGVILLLGLLFILFRRRRARRRRPSHQSMHNYVPYPLPGNNPPTATGFMHQTNVPSMSSITPYSAKSPSSSGHTSTGFTRESTNPPSRKAARMAQERDLRASGSRPTNSVPQQVIQHRDGGSVPDLPPAYGDAPNRPSRSTGREVQKV